MIACCFSCTCGLTVTHPSRKPQEKYETFFPFFFFFFCRENVYNLRCVASLQCCCDLGCLGCHCIFTMIGHIGWGSSACQWKHSVEDYFGGISCWGGCWLKQLKHEEYLFIYEYCPSRVLLFANIYVLDLNLNLNLVFLFCKSQKATEKMPVKSYLSSFVCHSYMCDSSHGDSSHGASFQVGHSWH